ncbi:MAG TPA: YdeI/OmpD-associated family protein [Candidatus Saccharimonadales bacterium]|nr:YdeI/OmpD-associated family protein [Candidatus Saccharimonadales bacterium]
MAIKISGGTVHKLSTDLRAALLARPKSLQAWENITPLARNEWICWVTTVKQADTRKNHVERTINELSEGKRRPCCWVGCIHRTDKPLSPSMKWVLERQAKKKH